MNQKTINQFLKIWLVQFVLIFGMMVSSSFSADPVMNAPAANSADKPSVSNPPVVSTPAANPPAATPASLGSAPMIPTSIPAPAPAASAANSAQPLTNSNMPIPGQDGPLPIIIEEPKASLEERMQTKISLDVRDMSVIDVLRFLALRGDFNLVTESTVQGRATFYLKSVSIKDALNIAVLSNKLAYAIENNIVRVMTQQDYELLFGKSFSDKREVEIVHLKYTKPSYALSALEGVKSTIGQIVVDEDTGNVVLIDTHDTIEKMKKTLANIEKPLESIVYSLQYAKADVVAEKLKARIDAQAVGSITVDERTDKLVIRALPERRAEVVKILKELDAPTKEVLIEVRVLAIVYKPSFDFGIDWNIAFKSSPYPELRALSFSNIMLRDSALTTSQAIGTNYGRIAVGSFSADNFALALRALKQVSDTKQIASPKLLVTNNQEAKIHVGDTVPYIVSTTSGTDPATAIHSEDVRFVDVGLKLSVKPTINDDGFVTMDLKPETSTVSSYLTSQGGGIPQITKTEVETTVMVKDGMTIVMGGLNKDQKISSRKGVPVLMDIPILKRFFSVVSDSIESSETVIFITPHIVTGKENYPEQKGAGIKPSKDYADPVQDEVQEKLKNEQKLKNSLTIKP